MNSYMTNGTESYLKSLMVKHPELNFILMEEADTAVLYYEAENEEIFESGRSYEHVITSGELVQRGYVVINNIPVTEEGRPMFEERFRQRQQQVEKTPGFQAFRLLRPISGNTYAAFTQWQSKQDFENWTESAEFKQAHANRPPKPPAYYADRPYIKKYTVITQEK
ncbi:antibiotic biosynthesis monooxygenase [Aciduricibacillus chroicocephali]|uniref:Antibiotic biosynthesis monooxygenase n=1 Tax=Aciduricibacillus chroicocephali TaxID=3054939 RepID=A0ABY9KXB1_9BACI|nr:antibiotic biosynthesis monooxygenase [Bacillaceae bacterium 44XB]